MITDSNAGAATPGGGLSWSMLYGRRKDILRRFGSHFSLPLARRAEEEAGRRLPAAAKVLDVGAGLGDFRGKIAKFAGIAAYKSLDLDPFVKHDFRSFDEVRETFDAVLMFEVLEHVPFRDVAGLILGARSALGTGGLLFCTTPSVLTPGRFGMDASHVTPLSHDMLGALLESCGFRVGEILRLYNAPFVRRFMHVRAAGWLHRFLSVDYAQSLMAVARKEGQ